MVLTDKLQDGAFIAVEDFGFPEAKTKFVAQMRAALPGARGSALIVVTADDILMKRAAKNLPRTTTIHAQSLNVRDAAKYRTIVASQAAIASMVQTFSA